jgi:exodeoxyribonuclease VII large subunit
MNDLPLAAPASTSPTSNLPEYTVSELSLALKRSIEENFAVVRVRGEVSGFKRVASGHCYMALKDSDAVLDAVCWRNTAIRLPVKPEDGMEVICTGRLTTYPGRSKYQLIIDTVELAGIGALLKLLEERRQRLAAEGLFAEERKKRLPYLPDVIGVVTSPTGAVIRDILHRLSDRFPRRVLLWPVAVQGDAAAAIPLISAVGHETDTTLIDFASDRRAPTPTAAAEIAVPVRLDLIAELSGKAQRVASALGRMFAERRTHLAGLARGLPQPQDLIGAAQQRLDDRAERLALAIRTRLDAARQRLAAARLRPEALAADIGRARARLDEMTPRLAQAMARTLKARHDALDNFAGRLATHSERHENLLARGYVVVHQGTQVLTDAAQVNAGAALDLEFHDGRVGVVAGGKPRRPRRAEPPPAQGQLL